MGREFLSGQGIPFWAGEFPLDAGPLCGGERGDMEKEK